MRLQVMFSHHLPQPCEAIGTSSNTTLLASSPVELISLFEKVEVDKPAASHSESTEIYVLGLRYKAPGKIDPRLLDVKHLFQGPVEPQPIVVDVLRDSKQKRHRDGYKDGNTTSRKVSSAANFIWSNSPLEILGPVISITFTDPVDLPTKDHDQPTEELVFSSSATVYGWPKEVPCPEPE